MGCNLALKAPNGETSELFKDLVTYYGTDIDAAIDGYYISKSGDMRRSIDNIKFDKNKEPTIESLIGADQFLLAKADTMSEHLKEDAEFLKEFKEFLPTAKLKIEKHIERLKSLSNTELLSLQSMQEFSANFDNNLYKTAVQSLIVTSKAELSRVRNIVNKAKKDGTTKFSSIAFHYEYANSYDMLEPLQVMLEESPEMFDDAGAMQEMVQAALLDLAIVQKRYMEFAHEEVATKLASVDKTTSKKEFLEHLKNAPKDVDSMDMWLAYIGDVDDRVLGAVAKLVKDSQRNVSRAQAEYSNKLVELLENVEKENTSAKGKPEELFKEILAVDKNGQFTGYILNAFDTKASSYETNKAKLLKLAEEKPALFEFYTHYVEHMAELDALAPGSKKIGAKLPTILKSSFERMSEGSITERAEQLSDNIRKQIIASNLDTETGLMVDSNGKPVKQVPIFFQDRFDSIDFNKAYAAELKKLGANPTEAQKNEAMEQARITAEELLPKRLSYDLAHSLQSYTAMMYNYHEMSQILPVLEGAKNIVSSAERKYTKTSGGKAVVDMFTGANKQAIVVSGNETNAAKLLEHLLDSQVYGIKEEDLGTLFNTNIDTRKLIKAMTLSSTMVNLAANVLAGSANIATGSHNTWMEAIAGEHFNSKNLITASGMYSKNITGIIADIGARTPTNLISQMDRYYDFLQDFDKDSHGVEASRATGFSRVARTSALFFMNNAGEHMLQIQGSMAAMEHIPTYDKSGAKIGTVLSAHSQNSKGDLEIADVYIKDVNNKLVKYGTREQNDVADKIGAIMRKLHGNYSSAHAMMAKKNAFGAAMLQFRGWMYEGFMRRFQTKTYNTMMQQKNEGFYLSTMKAFKNITGELMRLEGTTRGETWKTMSSHEKANVRRTMVEASVMLITGIAGAILMSAGKGLDDELRDKDDFISQAKLASFKTLTYLTNRLYTETAFYTNPIELMKIAKSPVPGMSTVSKLVSLASQLAFAPTEEYSSGFREGDYKAVNKAMKLMPIVNQLTKLTSNGMDEQIKWFNLK